MSAYKVVTTRDFPRAQSMLEAARENPSAFAWHVGYCARLPPRRLVWLAEHAGYLPRSIAIAIAAAAAAVLLAGAYAVARRRREVSPRLVAWLPIWLPVGASFAAAVLLIYPRDHYLVPFGFFAVATLSAACGALPAAPPKLETHAAPAGLAAAVALLVTLPTYRRGALPSLLAARGQPPPAEWDGRNTVEALRALDLPGERVVLDPEYSRAVYARLPVRWVSARHEGPPVLRLSPRRRRRRGRRHAAAPGRPALSRRSRVPRLPRARRRPPRLRPPLSAPIDHHHLLPAEIGRAAW